MIKHWCWRNVVYLVFGSPTFGVGFEANCSIKATKHGADGILDNDAHAPLEMNPFEQRAIFGV